MEPVEYAFTRQGIDLKIAISKLSQSFVRVNKPPATKHTGKRIRDVRDGPDGALWVLTDEEDGEVLRITPMD